MPEDGPAPHCPACGAEAPGGTRFCGHCGAPLARACASCGAELPEGFHFCGQCGTPVHPEQPGAEQPAAEQPVPAESGPERRHLTVLFCDLVDSTGAAARLDAEDYREYVGAFHTVCGDVIRLWGGSVVQVLGDGLMVYFGYPVAIEDAARRAVSAAVEVVAQLEARDRDFLDKWDMAPRARIGIHAGEAVTGGVQVAGHSAPIAVGTAPNVAARLQGEAPPNGVVVSAIVQRSVRDLFELEALGPVELKGIEEPMPLYLVRGRSRARSGLSGSHLASLTGRAPELELLLRSFDLAAGRVGQVATVVGEGGIGKSRLVEEFHRAVGGRARVLRCAASPYQEHHALEPVRVMLRWWWELPDHDEAAAARAIAARVAELGLPEQPSVPLLAKLLGVEVPGPDDTLQHAPHLVRDLTLQTLVQLLLAACDEGPVVLFVEDAHWIDPSTHEFLALLAEGISDSALLLVATTRPSERPAWQSRAGAVTLTLSRLSDSDVSGMIAELCDHKPLPEEVHDEIVARCDGIPLFVEELVRGVLESGGLKDTGSAYQKASSAEPPPVPDTLKDSLMARLDRLGAAKELAQVAAVIGRQFDERLLGILLGESEKEVRAGLRLLVDHQIAAPRGHRAGGRYQFRHTLLQEAAYDSLLRSRRRALHSRVADALVDVPDQIEARAHHLSRTTRCAEAAAAWRSAGEAARAQSANREAEQYFRRGLEQVEAMPDTEERTKLELGLLISLGTALNLTRGYGSAECETTFERARLLSEELGDEPDLFWAIHGLWLYYNPRAELKRAFDLANTLVRMARSGGDPVEIAVARYCLGDTQLFMGDIPGGLDALRLCMLDWTERSEATILHTGVDLQITLRCLVALGEALAGNASAATELVEDAVAVARDVGHDFGVAFALWFETWIRLLHRDRAGVERAAREVVELSGQHGFFWGVLAALAAGWADARGAGAEAAAEGIARMRGAIEHLGAAGVRLGGTFYRGILAEALCDAGRLDEADATLTEALDGVATTSERFWEPELLRVRAACILNDRQAAEALDRAVEMSRERGIGLLELRALTSRVEMTGDPASRDALARCMEHFDEADATADLTAAIEALQRS